MLKKLLLNQKKSCWCAHLIKNLTANCNHTQIQGSTSAHTREHTLKIQPGGREGGMYCRLEYFDMLEVTQRQTQKQAQEQIHQEKHTQSQMFRPVNLDEPEYLHKKAQKQAQFCALDTSRRCCFSKQAQTRTDASTYACQFNCWQKTIKQLKNIFNVGWWWSVKKGCLALQRGQVLNG